MMEFLYFPEDKSEYIPAFIMLVLFMTLALGALMLVLKKSKAEQKKFEEEYLNEFEEFERGKPARKDLDD